MIIRTLIQYKYDEQYNKKLNNIVIRQSKKNTMDVIGMYLMEDELKLPFDIMRFINGWVKPEPITDENIREAIKLWIENQEECRFKYGPISYWNTSRVTSMGFLFAYNKDFNEDISRWDVSNVTDMSMMFLNATSFNSDISNWNVSNVRKMSEMFHNAKNFNSDISQWNVCNVENAWYVLCNASSFNYDISNWNLPNRESRYMACGTKSEENARKKMRKN